jgi:hypothetical protein
LTPKIESLPFGPIVANAEIAPKYKGMQDVNVTKTLLVVWQIEYVATVFAGKLSFNGGEQVFRTPFSPFAIAIYLQR